jgi:hypothetical protein
MKKAIILLIFGGLASVLFAQMPLKMSYQAVIRNSSNQLVTNSPIGMRINILKGSSTGATVYTEIAQTASTNANGLVTLEIGSGNITFGGLGIIDWAHGPYFLKTETDPNGGTNYIITGVSELLSVPYTLYAEEAGNGFSGNYNDLSNKPVLFDGSWNSLAGKPTYATVATSGNYNDLTNKPVLFSGSYNDLSNKPALATVATSGNYNDLTNKPVLAAVATSGTYNDLSNKPVTDGSETKVTAGTNISVTGSGTSATPYVVNLNIPHYVGELYGGGVVFYVDQTGMHGLICSMIDLSIDKWSNITNVIGITAQNPWDGQSNTNAIIAQAGHTGGAAKICTDYTNSNYGTGVYSDWFLPSIDQLIRLHISIYEVNKAIDTDGNIATQVIFRISCWSSSEWKNPGAENYGYAFYYDFESCKVGWYSKNNVLVVRAIRAF